MSRSGASSADRALIAELAATGLAVSPYQLERWRGVGLVPRNRRRALGRGRGSTSEVTPETIDAVRMVARSARQGRPHLWSDALVRFATGHEPGEAEVRSAFARELEQWATRLAVSAGDDDAGQDARFEAAERFAKGVGSFGDLDELLAAIHGDDRASLAPRRARLAARVSAQVLAGGLGEVSDEEFLEATGAWLHLGEDQVRALTEELRQHQLTGSGGILDGIPAPTLESMSCLASTCSFETLRRSAVATFNATICGQALVLISMVAPVDDALFADPVWTVNCQFGGLATTHQQVRTMIVIGTLMNVARGAAWLDAVEEFAGRAQIACRDAMASWRHATLPTRPNGR